MLTLYSWLMRLLTPVFIGRLLLRSRSNPHYRYALLNRLGLNLPRATPPKEPRIWVHAVSVGETLAIAPLVEGLLTQYPERRLVLTSTTPTGAEQVARLFGDKVDRVWAPFDTPGSVARFLRHYQPALAIMVETEVWPNIVRTCNRQNIRIVLTNARLSKRSARGYAKVGALSLPTLRGFDAIACQHEADAQRFRALGVPKARVRTLGSLKFEIDKVSLQSRCDQLANELQIDASRHVLIIASTHPGEDEPLLHAVLPFLKAYPDSLVILAPRHPERAKDIVALTDSLGLTSIRRSAGRAVGRSDKVLILDTLGELGAAFGLANYAIIAGSFIMHGGHNPIEALALGVPTISGPHVFNFQTIFSNLRRKGAIKIVAGADELAETLLLLEKSPGTRSQLAAAGLDAVASYSGALPKQLALIDQQIEATAG